MVHHGDCLDVLRGMDADSVDSIVTDPPYGLRFMCKKWDYDVPSVEVWEECLRVLKPGGHLLAFAGTRTQHRMAVRIEDAGFEIRDMIAWAYGSGFPKSVDVSKAIEKRKGAEREVLARTFQGLNGRRGGIMGEPVPRWDVKTSPSSDAAKQWQGWGTALKPAIEPITVARKPMGGNVAENVLKHGTGGINVDGCRVEVDPADSVNWATYHPKPSVACGKFASNENGEAHLMAPPPGGRWPANLIHDGSEELVGVLGEAARFFYCAKASKADREEGCVGLERRSAGDMTGGRAEGSAALECPRTGAGRTNGSRNHHPTVKPTDLMRYLCRLVTPPGGTVLDPYAGSGSTGKAAILEGFQFVGIERDIEYVEIARARIASVAGGHLFSGSEMS